MMEGALYLLVTFHPPFGLSGESSFERDGHALFRTPGLCMRTEEFLLDSTRFALAFS
jgi:hypothetical protein